MPASWHGTVIYWDFQAKNRYSRLFARRDKYAAIRQGLCASRTRLRHSRNINELLVLGDIGMRLALYGQIPLVTAQHRNGAPLGAEHPDPSQLARCAACG
jgi:hypothetical protein